MLYVSDVYKLLLDQIRADKRGNSLEISEFNRLARLTNQEIFDDFIDLFETNTENSDVLAGFKIHNFGIDLTALASAELAYGTMPSNYYYVMGKPRILDGIVYRRVDEVTEYEDSCREDDYLTKATTTYPTCRIGGMDAIGNIQIKVRPQTITKVWVDYLREIEVPYLDYYVNDTTYQITFLPESTALQNIPLGSTHSSGTVGGAAVTVTSLTHDFEWGESELGLILAKLMQKVGATLPDQGIQQSGMADEIKTKE